MFGGFQVGPFQDNYQQGGVAVTPSPMPGAGGTGRGKGKKRVIIDDKIFLLKERDIERLVNQALQQKQEEVQYEKKAPVQEVAEEAETVDEPVYTPQRVLTTFPALEALYHAQRDRDIQAMIMNIALRRMMEIDDEEATLLLLN